MEISSQSETTGAAPAGALTYEPPRVEVVVTSAELNREALYAGEGVYGTF